MALQPNSQNARVLRVLSDGHWHTSSNLVRKTGAKRLNSRMSELRKHGYEIEREPIPGKTGQLGHRYRMTNPPTTAPAAPGSRSRRRSAPSKVVAPRDMLHRHRLYAMRFDELELVATATTPEDAGVALFTLGREGEFKGSCVGWLDTHGKEDEKGTWILNPFETEPA